MRRDDKTSHDKTRPEKVRQGETRQGKARQDNTRQDKHIHSNGKVKLKEEQKRHFTFLSV
jgi:hypothetical protein